MTTDLIGGAVGAVEQMRSATSHSAFTDGLGHFMGALAAILDRPQNVPAAHLATLEALGDDAVRLIEARICGDRHAKKFAGSIYEIRRRLELADRWLQYYAREKRA